MYRSLTLRSLLKAGCLALLFSYASGSPGIIPSELMDLPPPALLETRQQLMPPPNFDSELVTYTDDSGTLIKFLHYSGVDIIVNSGVTFHLTPPLSLALRLEKNFCSAAKLDTPARKRATPEFGPDGSIIISDDDLLEIDIDACLKAKVFFGIDRALQDGSFRLIPTTRQAKKLVAAVNNSFNNLVDDVAMYLEGRPGFEWVQQVQRRAAAAIAVANELGISIGDLAGGFTGDKIDMPGSTWFMSGNNTKLDCPNPQNWKTEHLICQTTACDGDVSTYRCGSAQYLGCLCIPRVTLSPPETYSEDFIDRQLVAFEKAGKRGLDNVNPVCNGLGTPLFMPREEAAAEIANFCPSTGLSASIIHLGHNRGSDRVLNFTSERTGPDGAFLTQDECKGMLLKLIDNCDGNSPDNPNNFKHGGSISALGWTLYLTPVNRQNPFCNRALGATNWVDRGVAIQVSKDLCNTPGLLNGRSGARFQNNANQGQHTALYVSIHFTRTYPMTFDECMAYMSVPIDSCDGNDPIGNPLGVKFGGHFVTDSGAVINVTPQTVPPTYPPSGKDINGRDQQAICGIWNSPKAQHDTIDAAINQFCVTDNFLGVGSMKEEHGKNYAHVGGRELAPDEANSAYQDGATACKHIGEWQGRIIANDCKYAMYKMRDRCFTSGTGINAWYTYRCVRWTMLVSEFA